MKMNRTFSVKPAPSDDAWVRDTLLVRRWSQMKSEIGVHKWYESERAGCDIGWDRATIRYTAYRAMTNR